MIYFDNSATTALCPEAAAGIGKAAECFANPSSLHSFGLEAEKMITSARKTILSSLGVNSSSHTLIFTSGGSEANNLAIKGFAGAKNFKNPKIIISNSEHPCIIEPCRALADRGFEICKLSTKGGEIDFEEFQREMTENVILISIMLVNNETGAVYNIREIFGNAKKINPNVICHTDAVQAYLKIPFTLKSTGADAITLSSHKIHGPKGCGALILDKKLITAKKIVPLISGGGQEYGIRSGTENTIGINGFACAAEHGFRELGSSSEKMRSLREYIIKHLPENVTVNQSGITAPHIINITLPGIKSETMLHYLSSKGIYVSSGSACSSHGKHGSYVLRAFGLDEESADAAIRVSICESNTYEEADKFIFALDTGIKELVPMRKR